MLESNNIYHRRWGDAPLRFLQVQMFYSNDEVDTVVTYPLHEVFFHGGMAQVVKFCEFGYQHSTWPVSERCANLTQRVHVYEHVKENIDLLNVWMN